MASFAAAISALLAGLRARLGRRSDGPKQRRSPSPGTGLCQEDTPGARRPPVAGEAPAVRGAARARCFPGPEVWPQGPIMGLPPLRHAGQLCQPGHLPDLRMCSNCAEEHRDCEEGVHTPWEGHLCQPGCLPCPGGSGTDGASPCGPRRRVGDQGAHHGQVHGGLGEGTGGTAKDERTREGGPAARGSGGCTCSPQAAGHPAPGCPGSLVAPAEGHRGRGQGAVTGFQSGLAQAKSMVSCAIGKVSG